jgi:membrane-bound metal-dependent hydrolase YbcI (DUF457 family)
MAINKSKDNFWLGLHVSFYTLSILIIFGWKFAIINGILHFITDYITSRGTSYLWKTDQRHLFFTLIGFDQAIHLTTLALTYRWLIHV